MLKEKFYAEKPFKMVSDTEELIRPFGPLYVADRDFLTFELLFFYYFIYDYKMFCGLDEKLRRNILSTFLAKIQEDRADEFPDVKLIDKFYETRIFAYFTIVQKLQTMGEFSERCAEYINILLSYSEKNNVFTCHSLDQAQRELGPEIEPDKYTAELKSLLAVSSSLLMIDGIDPTENKKERSSKNWFSKWFK
jgi:hypothetical protein